MGRRVPRPDGFANLAIMGAPYARSHFPTPRLLPSLRNIDHTNIARWGASSFLLQLSCEGSKFGASSLSWTVRVQYCTDQLIGACLNRGQQTLQGGARSDGELP
jgi:hypothetical protein